MQSATQYFPTTIQIESCTAKMFLYHSIDTNIFTFGIIFVLLRNGILVGSKFKKDLKTLKKLFTVTALRSGSSVLSCF